MCLTPVKLAEFLENSLELDAEPQPGPVDVDPLTFRENPPEPVLKVGDHLPPDGNHDAAAEGDHRLGEIARQVGADGGVRSKAGGRGVDTAQLKRHFLADLGHAESAEDVGPD